MIRSDGADLVVSFPTDLGWMAMIGSGRMLKHLTFGHATADRAVAALMPELARGARQGRWNQKLVERLRAYASGAYDDFLDVEVDSGLLTPFRRKVLARARRIAFGTTLTYGQLAAQAGFPGAVRAVGQCMAGNRIPLVIPCHRVVAADGSLRGYSASGGLRMKRRLLELEAARVCSRGTAGVSFGDRRVCAGIGLELNGGKSKISVRREIDRCR